MAIRIQRCCREQGPWARAGPHTDEQGTIEETTSDGQAMTLSS